METSEVVSSMRVGLYRVGGTEPLDERILAFAGMAMFFRYGEDEHGFNWYDHDMFDDPVARGFISRSLVTAIDEKQFYLRFQPVFPCSDSHEIVMAEALVRWHYLPFGEMPPSIFIPIIEKMRMTEQLDIFVLSSVCSFQEGRVHEGKKTVPITVNLSRDSILLDAGFTDKIVDLVDGFSLDHSLVQFEIVEGFSSYGCSGDIHYGIIRRQAKELHKDGFGVLIDDYGTGMSNIRTICDMPFDTLKIDKSLISRCGEPFVRHILEHLISCLSESGKKVIAEGVETEEQLAFLQTTSCTAIQGFLRCRPLLSKDFIDMLD